MPSRQIAAFRGECAKPIEASIALSDSLPPTSTLVGCFTEGMDVWCALSRATLDSLAAEAVALFAGARALVHAACLTEDGANLMQWSGLPSSCDCIPYEDGREALGVISRLGACGSILLMQYQLPPQEWRRARWLCPPALQARLNNKGHLADWVPSPYRPVRRLVPGTELDRCRNEVRAPLVLKAGSNLSTGAGFAVRFCRTPGDIAAALDFFACRRGDLSHVVCETMEEFQATWCANTVVFEDGCRYLGAARQVCSRDGIYQGNHVGVGLEPPEEVRALALEIAGRSWRAGYRGIAGFDIGLTEDGRLLVFDLNFRINGCTKQLLFHQSACERIGARISRGARLSFRRPLSEVATTLRALVEAGKLVVFAALDGSRHEQVGRGCALSAMLLGDDIEEVDALLRSLQE